MNGFDKLHKQQDDFIKKTLQEDKIVSQPIFDSFSNYMDQSKVKVKRYSYKQQKIIILLLLLLLISVCFNVYFAVIKQTPITITNIFESGKDISESQQDEEKVPPQNIVNEEEIVENTITNTTEDTDTNTITNTVENVVENTVTSNQTTNTVIPSVTPQNTVTEKPSTSVVQTPGSTTITPNLYTDINTSEVKDFVNQFSIGINKLNLSDANDLESNTVLLYIAQQYFTAKSNTSSSLAVDTIYASTTENFHRFLSEFTIKDYSTVDYIKSYNNYIGYASRSNSYIYGNDYSTLAKEKYKCTDVTITGLENNVYSAKASVTRTYEGEESTYEITFTFKVNSNFRYQKYKLLSLNSKITSGALDNAIHLVGN